MRVLGALILLLPAVLTQAADAPSAPTAEWLGAQVHALAGPEMRGRRSGTEDGERAARYLAAALAGLGLRPAGDAGTFLQSFVLATGTGLAGPGTNVLQADGGPPFVVGRDWAPHGGAPDTELTAEVVFAGHGVVAPGRDDYGGLDVRGRLVVVRGGSPDGLPSSRLDKLLSARARGAVGVLVVEEPLPSLAATATRVDIPSASVTPAVAEALRARDPARLRLAVSLTRREQRAANVIGLLPGRHPELAAEAIVIGAHYDHLGEVDGAVHPGADDNASGTALVLGLARAFAAAGGASRTLVFAFFGGEELGLLGSRHYVGQPTVPLPRTAAMLNFDMVGRLRDDRLHVGGVDSGSTLRGLVQAALRGEGLEVVAEGSPWAPSDHQRFYAAGAPVLFFFTGRHADYHRPTDTPDKIETAGLARIARAASRLVSELAAGDRPRYVQLSGPARSGVGASGTAFFGIMFDGRAQGDGVPVGAVVPASAAARAGLTEGDVIVRFDDIPVAGFAQFQQAVRRRRPGDRFTVVYLRDGQPRVGSETLDARP
jgi:hypothetical protein